MRKWKIIADSSGELSVLGPKINPSEKVTVIDVSSLIELMEICDRHLVSLGEPPSFAKSLKQLREVGDAS